MSPYADPDEELKYWLDEISEATDEIARSWPQRNEAAGSRYMKAVEVLNDKFPLANR